MSKTAASQPPSKSLDSTLSEANVINTGVMTTRMRALTRSTALNILVVDDDEIELTLIGDQLESRGFHVVRASNAEDGLALMVEKRFPVLLTDIQMPGMDGLQFTRRVRSHGMDDVYIIMLNMRDASFDFERGYAAGVDEYLTKTLPDVELHARINAAFHTSALRRELREVKAKLAEAERGKAAMAARLVRLPPVQPGTGDSSRVLSLEHSLKSALDERRRMVMTDALTGAHNRRYFMRYLLRELKRAARFGTDLSLLLMDIDFFKKVNDEFGHTAGDVVLQKFVKRVQKGLPRDYDWCARLGGEEFVVVLPQTDLAGAAVVAERLRKMVEAYPLHLSESVRPITVSIGVSGLQALPKRESVSIESLLADAERHLYKSKDNGRNRVTVAPPHAATP